MKAFAAERWGGGGGGGGGRAGERSQAGSTRRGWGLQLELKAGNLGCLMVTWGVVLEVRNI